MSISKICSKCGDRKVLEDFYRNRGFRDGRNSWCKACEKTLKRIRYEQDKERICQKSTEWRKANPDRYRELMRAAQKRRWAKDPEAARQRSRDYYAQNKEQEVAKVRRWQQANPEKTRERNLRREVRLMQNGFEPIDSEIVYQRDKGRCHICGEHIERELFSLDHLIPISQGGPHYYWNVSSSHLSCNLQRGAGRIETMDSTIARSLFLGAI